MSSRQGEEGLIPISQRVITQQSQSTIKSLLDALVELVTNCDDSYRRLHSEGKDSEGPISIYVKRERGGQVSHLGVRDNAEGMGLDRIIEILEFASDQSGFTSGKNIRGLFGKGMKEAIFALGVGRIDSVFNGFRNVVSVWTDQASGQHFYRIDLEDEPSNEPNGTLVEITVTNSRIRSPRWSTFREQFSTHFALRGICSTDREVKMEFEDVRTTHKLDMSFVEPETKTVKQETLAVTGLGGIDIRIEESEIPLGFAPRDPGSIAGFIVASEGIPLDNTDFTFGQSDALKYFTGVIEVPAIARMIRDGDLSILDPSRSGIDWRNNDAKRLQSAVVEILRTEIDRKTQELESAERTATREVHQRQLNDVCRLLNQLANLEIEPDEPIPGPGEIASLAIRPTTGNALPGVPRSYTVYLPKFLIDPDESATASAELLSVQGNFTLDSESVELVQSNRHDELLSGILSVSGDPLDSSCLIHVIWEDQEDMAEFRVRTPGERGRPGPPRATGMFREIRFDDQTADPIQRVSYSSGFITVFLEFPAVGEHLGPGGDGLETREGALMCAELVVEAFCREVARERIDSGAVLVAPGGEIDAYNSELNSLSKRHSGIIHNAFTPR